MSNPDATARRGRPAEVTALAVAKIRAGIAADVYPVGSKLPSSRRLSERMKISRETILKALDELHEAGDIEKRPGRGVFVNVQPHLVKTRADYDVTRKAEEWRGLPAAIRRSGGIAFSTITFAGEIQVKRDVAGRLQISTGATVFERARIQGAVENGRDVPIQTSRSYYTMGVVERVPEIRSPAEAGATQIRSRIVAAYGAVLYEHETTARHATNGESDMLGLPDMAVVYDSWRLCVEASSGVRLEVTHMVMDARKITLHY